MRAVPISFKIHVTLAWALLGLSPFSRLVHIWSVPVTYLFRRYVVFRRREERFYESQNIFRGDTT
jgi:nitrate reductase gamma subunit